MPTAPPRISLMAAAEVRDILTALQLGQSATAIAGLMAIDADSWQAIEQRLAALDGDLPAALRSLA
ncbi:hypothetical protein [Streptomyces sp. NBC_01477]|uniref:hypothetical protein n=1 Tax=Streptomyces sp. NBC_01477 TaxID=2976015 RepID=UPI002E303881|nr:hypothetical protein [Streptomyces sp. NBC_01477]